MPRVDHRLRNALAVMTMIYVAALIPAVGAVLAMPTIWESQVTLRVSLFGFFLASGPIVLVVATVAAWLAYFRKRHRLAVVVIATPLLWTAITMGLMGV